MMTNLLFSQLTAIGKRLVMVLTMLLIVGIGQAWGYTGTFTLVESYNSSTGLENGYYVITASPSASKVQAMGTTISSGRATGQAVTISNKTITNPSDGIVWYIEKSGSTYSFKNVNDNKYIYQSSTTSGRGLSTSTTKQSNWSINTYYSTSPIGFCFTSSQNSNNYLKWNNSSSWFSTYQSGYTTSMAPVALYKLNSTTKTLSSISVSGQTTTYNVGDVFSFDGTCTAKYSDNSTKSVTPTSVSSPNMSNAGEKTITVSYTEGDITRTTNYTITVTEASSGGDDACDKWVEVDLSDIQDTDDVVIAMEKAGTIWALPNNGGTSTPSAVVINSENLASKNGIADNLTWNISNSSGTLTIYPTGDTSKWLYCNNGNDGVRVGTNANKTFTIDASSGYLKHTSTSRYVGVFITNPDWRCYTSTTGNSNIAGQTLKFYKYVECGSTQPTYNVTLHTDGGTINAGNVTDYAEGVGATLPTDVTKTGYTFAGWYDNELAGNKVTAIGPNETGDKEFWAKWTANTYTVTLNQKGGTSGTESISATYDATMPNITVPTRTGYTFGGYWTNENGTGTQYYNQSGGAYNNKKWDQATAATLYAKWTANKYTVKFNGNDNTGGSMSDQSFTYDTPQNLTTNAFTRIGYTFNGWNTNASGSGISYTDGQEVINLNSTSGGQITLYAQWTELPKYTVSFSTGTGNPTQVAIQETTGGAGITLPAGPTPACNTDGWTFAGWWTESVAETITSPGELLTAGSNYKPTSNCTLYAVYSHTEAGGGGSGFYLSVTQDATTYYIGEKGSGSFLSAVTDVNSAATFNIESNQYLYYGNKTYVSSTANSSSLTIATTTPTVTWAITDEGETITFQSNGTGERYLAFNYNSGSPRFSSYNSTYTYELTKHTTSTTTYNSNPSCEVCENILTINKGAETNGKFSLSPIGEIKTCDGDLVVTVSEISPAEHHSVASVTATTPPTGDAPTVTNNGDGTWTVTYKQNSTGESTINVTFVQDAKASITLSELGVPTTDNTTYYVGETYTLPSTSSQSCDGKQLVGWSTVEVAETNTKPTSNYYELGAKVTLAETQTFYAVFATLTAGGEGTVTKINEDDDFHYGDKIIIIAENTNYGLYRSSSSNYVSYWETSNNNGVPTAAEIEADSKRFIEISEGTTEGTIKLGNVTDGYLYNPSSTDLSISTTNASDWELIAWNDNTFTFKAIQYLSCRTDLSGTNANKWRGAGGSCNCETGDNCSGIIYYNIYRYTSGSSYTAYTTSCVPTYSITYDFAGGTGSHCSNTSVPQGDSYIICDEEPTKEGYTFQGWSDGINTYQPNNRFTPTKNTTLTAQWQIKTYTVIWSNNGDTDEVPYNHGDALVVPTAASCDGVKEFVGWTEQSGYYHATTAPDDIFTTKTTPVTADATYYAVFATPPTTGGGSSIETTDDVLTCETTGVTEGSTNYASWSGKTATSSAVYAGNSAGGNNAIQLRSNNSNSGIVTTTSGGKVTHVEVDWESNTASDRTLDIYGRNVAYSDATDLYSTSTQGTKLGSIVCGTSTELEITGDYEYIGLRSNSGAMYLTSVTITWSSAGGSSSYTDYTTICQEVTGIAISGSYPTTFVQYDSFSFAGGIVTATFENGATQDVTSLATFSDYNMDEVGVQTVTVTYMGQTAKYEITINQSDRWRLTWNVSGKTNTGASPIYVQKGSAIGTLPVPEVPAACEGKTFMGWTESNIVPSDGKGIVYITEETVPSKNTTYYAVFATINNFSTQAAIEDIKSGSKVVIVAVASMDASGGAGQAISSRTISITKQGVIGLSGDEVSIFDETINTPHSTCIWTLTKEGGGIVFEQGGKYIRAVDGGYRKLLLETTKDYWTLSPVEGKDKTYHMQSGNTSHYVEWFDHTDSKYDEGERYIGFVPYIKANDNGDFDMQFYVTANADGNADITDYTTGCEEYTITYYGFRGGYSTSTSSDGTIVLPVNSLHTVPNCGDVVTDHTNLGRTFTDVWMTQPHGGHTFKPGDTFILTQDTTLYAQWKLETNSDVTTLPTDIEDLAGTDIYVYGGTTLNIQPGTTTINSLTLKGGLQADGSYKMPTVWVPEGATLVRNSNKIYLDLAINAKNYYPFAVPFAAKNNEYVEYLDPVLAAASTYGTHFVIKTYDGARRAEVGEDKANNWVRVLRGETLQPGVGYIITALTYPDKETATIRIPMTVPNTWFKNGEQAEVSTTVRNTIAVTAHTGPATDINNGGHQRHAGWNFVANPYLTSFTGGNVVNDGGLAYINGELIIEGSYKYTDEEVPYVTIPAYDFAYYSQHKLSDVKLSPEWSFFVQVGTDGTMNFTTAGRQQAPAHLAARAAEQPIKMDVDITLSDDNHSDQTGLIICDRFSDAYEIGHDLEKLFGSAYNLSVYTLMADNTPLAFQALAIQNSMQVIPVGYRAPAQGEYTFALNEATSDIELLNEQYEQLILVDYETGALTNMLNNEYTFYSDRTQSNNRFALYAVPRQDTTTDLPNTIGNEEVKKVIYNDHFYILRNGKVFNGAGQIVK